jgi:Bacterial Ig domain
MRTRTVLLGCLIASLMGAALALAQELKLTRAAESGVDTRIAHERAWDRSCVSLPVTVSITKNPVNGTVSVAPVRYKSKSGFHGTDSVSYNVVSGGRPAQARVIIINVK